MSYETLLISLADGLARITVNQPEVALTKEAVAKREPEWKVR